MRATMGSNGNRDSSPSLASGNNSNCKLFIGGLAYQTTDESLRKHFAQYGPILSTVVMRDAETNQSRGFGFVTFTTPEAAKNALSNHHHVVDGRMVESKLAIPRRPKHDSNGDEFDDPVPASPTVSQKNGGTNLSLIRATPTPTSASSSPTILSPNTSTSVTTGADFSGSISPPVGDFVASKIFVGGLRYATTYEALRLYFEKFGAVESTQVIVNRDTKKSRGFGYVVFSDPTAVDRVLGFQKESPHVVEGKEVEVKTCIPRQDSPGIATVGSISPRAVPQTPIATRTDSYSSLTSASSVTRGHVSTTPVRPSVFTPVTVSHLQQDPWSPVVFEDVVNQAQKDRRSSVASSVRSGSPFGSLPSGYVVNGPSSEAYDSAFVNPSPFASPNYGGKRESPSMFFGGQRIPPLPVAVHPAQRRDDSGFSLERSPPLPIPPQTFSHSNAQQFSSPPLTRNSSNNGNPDVGLFDVSAFSAAFQSSPGSMMGRQPDPFSPHFPSTNGLFKPLSPLPPSNSVTSPTKVIARSPVIEQSLVFPNIVTSSNSSIW